MNEHVVLIWEIRNYSKKTFVFRDVLQVSRFCFKINDQVNFWTFQYCPMGCHLLLRNYVSCYLHRSTSLKGDDSTDETPISPLIIDFKIEIVSPTGKIVSYHRAKKTFDEFHKISSCDDLMSIEKLRNEMKNWSEDILTIRISVTNGSLLLPLGEAYKAITLLENNKIAYTDLYQDYSTFLESCKDKPTFSKKRKTSNSDISPHVDPNSKSMRPSALQIDLKDLLVNQRHTDVKLHVGDKIYPAHKTILMARSPVFEAMLNQDFGENRTGTINIHDVDEKTFEVFLEFLYTETADDIDSVNVINLLIIANKYRVHSLENECVSYLNSNLSNENVCSLLVTAQMIGNDSLKSKASDFLITHAADIIPSSEWSQLIEEDVKLVAEIIAKLTKKYSD